MVFELSIILSVDFNLGWQTTLKGKMGVSKIVFTLFLIQVLGTSVVVADNKRLNIWPMPKSVSYGSKILHLSDELVLKTEGSKYIDASGILKEGFSRIVDVIKGGHVIEANFSHFSPSQVIKGIHVVILSPKDEIVNCFEILIRLSKVRLLIQLQHGIDESYKLSIPEQGNPLYAYIEAPTVYGALHGLQTFSQVCQFNFRARAIEIHHVPWTILDQPRFSYRGLLIDTSRHYLPIPVIKQVIESMTYAKLNVLHWHIVDTQSFPLEIPSHPKLWNGAYSKSERYTMAEAAEIVRYAQRQGIHVLAEIDVPGHAESWGVGYPSLWPSANCTQPLDVSKDFTFKVIDGILSDFSKVFKYKFVHLGGDEVDTSCWTSSPHISIWLEKNRLNGSTAYQYFVLQVQKIALSHGYEIINWLGGGVAEKVVAAGLRCIVSNQDKWYLDHLDATWQGFYMNEPLTNITKPEQQALILGGEVCVWGEHIDASDIEQTIWPRAAAAAERMWTSYDKLAKDPREVTGRLAHFRCLLNQRGVATAPLFGPGRVALVEPRSCNLQEHDGHV